MKRIKLLLVILVVIVVRSSVSQNIEADTTLGNQLVESGLMLFESQNYDSAII